MASQDELIVRIGADFSELKSQLKKAGDETEKFGRQAKDSAFKIDRSFASVKTAALGVAGAVGTATIAIGAMTKEVIQNAKEQRLWARRLSVSEESFGALSAVAKRFGAETDDVGDAIKDLNERIADAARGNKTYEEALNMVGLKSKELIDLPIDEQFLKVADAIGKMNNAGDRNFITAELMADAGFRLLEVFRLGENGIRKMKNEVLKTNEALTQFELKQLEDASRASRELEAAFTGFKNVLAREALPALKTMTMLLKDAAKFWGDVFGQDEGELKAELEEVNKLLDIQDAKTARLKETLSGMSRRARGRRDLERDIADSEAEGVELANRRVELQRELNGLKKLTTEETKSENEAVATGPMLGPDQNPDIQPFNPLGEDVLSQNLETYQAFLETKKELDEVARMEDLNSFAEYQLQLGEIAKKQRMADQEAEKKKDAMMLREREKFFGNLSSLMASHSRKAFEVGKAAAIAQTTISTIESAQKSFNSLAGIPVIGPALGAAAAGAAIAAGFARVQAISSTSMGGGGGGLAGGVGGGAGVGATPQAPENVVDATFNLQTEQGFVSTDQIRGVASGLNEFIEDGGKIRSVSVI